MKKMSRKAESIAQHCAAGSLKSSFCPLASTPDGLRHHINLSATRGDELRAAYLLGIEFARIAIAAATGRPEIYHQPPKDEVGAPNWSPRAW